MNKAKKQLTAPELIGFNLLIEQGKRATALAAVYDDPTIRIMETDKYYLAQQNVSESEQALRAYLVLCGVNPEMEHVMSDGTIESSVPPISRGEQAARAARNRQSTVGLVHEVVNHPVDPDKQEFPAPPVMSDNHASP